MKKLLMLSACIFICYTIQAQCGGCAHHKQTSCGKTTQTVKLDSTQKVIAVPADKQIRSAESTTAVRPVPAARIQEMPKKEENNSAVPVKANQKATISEENSKNNSAR
jgi:hypothetical protein